MLRTCQGCNSQPDVNEEIFHFLLQCIKLSRKNIIYYQEPTILYDLNINEVRSDLSRGKMLSSHFKRLCVVLLLKKLFKLNYLAFHCFFFNMINRILHSSEVNN